MSSIFLDSLAMDLELLQRVNSTIALVDRERLKSSGMPLHHVDFCVACPDTPLEGLAHQHVGNLPASIRFLMRSIGAMRKGGAALASYLLFDKDYCRALINMGYENTIKRRDELTEFFDPDATPAAMEIPLPRFNPDITQQSMSRK
jgi:NTE family protein